MGDARRRGTVTIADEAIAELVAHTARQAYGVVGMDYGSIGARIGAFLGSGPGQGVKVERVDDSVSIDVYIMVEHGTNLREIVKNLCDHISYTVKKHTKLDVRQVDVHIAKIKT